MCSVSRYRIKIPAVEETVRRSPKRTKCVMRVSKFITSLTLQFRYRGQSRIKNTKEIMFWQKQRLMISTSYVCSDLEGGKNDVEFEDVSRTVCDDELFQSDKNSLDDAEGTCGGAPVPNTNDKGASFLQLEAEDSPMTQGASVRPLFSCCRR